MRETPLASIVATSCKSKTSAPITGRRRSKVHPAFNGTGGDRQYVQEREEAGDSLQGVCC